MNAIYTALKKANDWVGIIAGIALFLGVLLIFLEIILRIFSVHFSGAEEISGYLMASLSSWGISYALLRKAHVRIDILRNKSNAMIRSLFDLLALSAIAFVAVYIATKVISVLTKSLNSGALSNTALEIPLYIPQSIWLAGWIWFAISSVTLSLFALYLFVTGQYKEMDQFVGVEAD